MTPESLASAAPRAVQPPRYQPPRVQTLDGISLLYADVPEWKRSVKRAIDIVVSAFGLVCFGLLLPLLALIIKFDSRGSIFYSHTRVGINRRARERRSGVLATEQSRRSRDRRKILSHGSPFAIHKLRTMYKDAESDGARWASKGDERITRVGNLLRVTRLDECPQFWNVLRGEMSLVGPRPERPPFIELLSGEVPGYLDRLRFKPGITGLAQVELGYDTDVDSVGNKVACDVDYITNFGLMRDCSIIARTGKVVITGRGAF
jgi:lipopolysaccharide/colanic/teichoic acid biosynthesis glycosyltransferase